VGALQNGSAADEALKLFESYWFGSVVKKSIMALPVMLLL
jgi:hypothetical protein